MEELKRDDFNFSYDYFGHMIQYMGKNIGGAGVMKPYGRKVPSNLKFNREQAEITVRDILNGSIHPYMKKAIEKIQEEDKKVLTVFFKTEILRKFALLLIKNDFKVYTSKNKKAHEKTTYLLFEKDNKIGYCQDNYFGGLDFSTCHKPNSKIGTGYRLNSEGVGNPTVKHALNAFSIMANWSHDSIKDIVKYRDWNDYLKTNTVLKYVEVKVIK